MNKKNTFSGAVTGRNKSLLRREIVKASRRPGYTRDNAITNRMVLQGKLPASRAEIYPQGTMPKRRKR